ncbi:hypothetical protein IC229_05885 [Spirosoma sp. BT702]|uniref:Uncharacterized protein n=1 Tax=Spirosoma profusum TaxID=2771354 RepID=A0A926XV03_9BACT|nr:hypothetical protein [Spirosoma profusum]MBD2700156.1 hypothetical protein [Spirosoma profusum]
MIAITNDNGLTLQLSPGQNLVTEQATSWLSDDELPGEFSYPIDAPLNDNNKRFVEHSYRPDAAQPRSEMAVTVRMQGVLYRRATFNFRVEGGKLNGFLKIDASEFYDKIRKMSLLEALPDSINLGDSLTKPLAAQLETIAKLPPSYFPCTFFPIRNPAFLEESFGSDKLPTFVRNDYVNAWEKRPDGSIGFMVDSPTKSGYLICPQFYLSYVLERIMTLAGYTIESDWLSNPETQRLVVENLTAMNVFTPNVLVPSTLLGHRITAGQCLPDMSVSDFLKAIKGRYGLMFSYNANSRVCTIAQFKRTVALGPAIDLTPYQVGAYSTGERENKGYTIREFIDEQDELYKDEQGRTIGQSVEIIGKGTLDIVLRVGTSQLAYEPSRLSTGAFWLISTVRQAGNVLDASYSASDRYPDKEGKRRSTIGLKLLSYRGMTTDSKNNAYPLGTPDIRNGQQQVVGQESLGLSGQNGAWQKALRDYYYFRDQTLPIVQNLLLPVGVLAQLPLYRSVSLTLDDFILRSYLIKQIRAEMPGLSGLAKVRLEALSLPPGLDLSAGVETPLVWLELIQAQSGEGSYKDEAAQTDGLYVTTSLTIKAWTTATRTQAIPVTNLPVTIRLKKTYNSTTNDPPQPYKEYVLQYLANGSVSVIEPALLTFRLFQKTGQPEDYYDQTAALDPGDGYNIIA